MRNLKSFLSFKIKDENLEKIQGGTNWAAAVCGAQMAGSISGTNAGSTEREIIMDIFIGANPQCAQYF